MHNIRSSIIDVESWTIPVDRSTLRPPSSGPARRTGGHGKHQPVRRKPVWQFPVELLIMFTAIGSLMAWWVR